MTTTSKQSITEQIYLYGAVGALALIYFFIPAGRFQGSILGISFSTGYDAFKLVPIPFAFWLLWRYSQRTATALHSSYLLPFTALFIVTLVSGAASPDRWQALADTLELLCYLGLLILLANIPWTPGLLQIPAAGFLIGNLYLGGVILKQFFAMQHADTLIRLSGTFNHPNTLGIYAILGFTLLIWLTRQTSNKIYRILLWIAAGLVLFSLLLTQSRTAFVALVVWGVAALWMGNSAVKKYTGIMLLVSVAATLVLAAPVLSRFTALKEEIPDPSRINRPLIWRQFLFHEIPELPPFGVGMGPVSTNRFGDWIASNPDAPPVTRSLGTHNTYLAFLIGAGLTGLFVLLWLFKIAWNRLQQCDPFTRTILSAGLLSLAATCFFQDPLLFSNIPIAWITLIVIGDRLAPEARSEKLS